MAKGSNTFGGTVKLDGESEYRKALSNITAQLGVVGSEMKKVTAEFGKNDKSIESLSKKDDILTKRLEAQENKVNTLRGALELAKKEYGETDTKTLKWEKSLNNAEAELIKTKKEIEENNKALEEASYSTDDASKKTDDLADSFDKAGKHALSMGDIIKANVISDYIVRGIDAVVGKLTSVGSAIKDLVISGGMDRALNIQNAQTKIQALGYDVDKVVSSVDEAVTDTAFSMDEAMNVASGALASGVKEGEQLTGVLKTIEGASTLTGRSMEDMGAIWNKVSANGKVTAQELNQLADAGVPALQWLSDSYGKSTEEMQKMVSAGKVSFDDFERVMSDKLGSVAEEMGTTFESANANLQSSFKRLGQSIMEPLIDVETGLTPMMVTVKQMVKDLSKGVTDNVDELSDQLIEQTSTMIDSFMGNLTTMADKILPVLNDMLQKILTRLPELTGQLIPQIVGLLSQVAQVLLDNLPLILNAIIQMVIQLASALADELPVLIPCIIQAVIDMANTLLDNIDLIIDAGIQLLIGLADGLLIALPQLIDRLPEIIDKIVMALTDNLPKLVETGIELTLKLAVGLIKAIPQLISKIPQIISSLINGFANYYSKMGDVGLNIIKGILDGFGKATEFIKKAIKKVGETMLNGIKDFFHIHSPAKNPKLVYYSQMIAQGIGVSFTDEMDKVSEDMANAIPTNFDITPNVQTGFSGKPYYNQFDNEDNSDKGGNFTAIINNNSKYTSPSENIRRMRQEYELYRLKYGKVGA